MEKEKNNSHGHRHGHKFDHTHDYRQDHIHYHTHDDIYDHNIHDQIRSESINETVDENNYGKKNRRMLSGPVKIIIGLFVAIVIILWMIPYYYVKENPHPKYIPEIDEVFEAFSGDGDANQNTDVDLPRINLKQDYRHYVDYRNPQVKAVADRISSKSCVYSKYYIVCQSKALYLFVRDKFDYIRDPSSFEYVKTPLESLRNLGGDCDDASVLLASLLGSIGIRTRLVFIPGHVYVEAYLPEASVKYKAYRSQDWVALDATCKNCYFGRITLKDAKADKQYVEVT